MDDLTIKIQIGIGGNIRDYKTVAYGPLVTKMLVCLENDPGHYRMFNGMVEETEKFAKSQKAVVTNNTY